jgi:hypothetical protein
MSRKSRRLEFLGGDADALQLLGGCAGLATAYAYLLGQSGQTTVFAWRLSDRVPVCRYLANSPTRERVSLGLQFRIAVDKISEFLSRKFRYNRWVS